MKQNTFVKGAERNTDKVARRIQAADLKFSKSTGAVPKRPKV